jgi:uncharacterized protein (DUF885 family)
MPNTHPIYPLSAGIVDDIAALWPDVATYIGIHDHDARWPDLSPEGAADSMATLRGLRRAVGALPSADDRWSELAIAVNLETLNDELEPLEHGDYLADLNSIASPLQSLRDTFDQMPTATTEDFENICARLEGLEAALGGYRATLALGTESGRVAAIRQVEEAARQAGIHASSQSALADLTTQYTRSPVDDSRLANRLERAVTSAKAAFGEFSNYLQHTYSAHARLEDPVGEERYLRAARRFLGTDIDPPHMYEWAWDEVADLRNQMQGVATQIAGEASVSAALDILTTDPDRAAPDPAAFRAQMSDLLSAALDQLAGTHFDVPDQIRTVDVKLTPAGGPIGASYVSPSEDFTRPGTVWWSLDGAGPVPLFDQVTTAYHEGFPGHHLQSGIQISLSDRLSRLHRVWTWLPGIGEGWALYAERLMDELGYLDKVDYRFGLLAAQMLRACRVVLDLGIHLRYRIPDNQSFRPGEPWTFESAVEFLMTDAALGANYAADEVVRYMGWPGQAISYRFGERFLIESRDEMRRRQGDAFDLKAFHARVLEVGPVGIDLARATLFEDPAAEPA